MADITSTSVPIDNSIELDELILAIANQDEKALQMLYCQYRRSIFAVAYTQSVDQVHIRLNFGKSEIAGISVAYRF